MRSITSILFVTSILLAITLQQTPGSQQTQNENPADQGISTESSGESAKKMGVIVGIVLGSFFLAFLLIGGFIRCYRKYETYQTQVNKRMKIKERYCKRVINQINQKETEKVFESFSNLLQGFSTGQAQFSFYNKKKRHIATVTSNRIEKNILPGAFDVWMEGNDYLGNWEGEGQLLMTENGPFFWMLKVYDAKSRPGKEKKWTQVLFESTTVEAFDLEGNSFYPGFENRSNLFEIRKIYGDNLQGIQELPQTPESMISKPSFGLTTSQTQIKQ